MKEEDLLIGQAKNCFRLCMAIYYSSVHLGHQADCCIFKRRLI
jgi:hypothetical protein